MLRRNLLIGSLVAGAFVLPSLAQAGVVTGACANCHTMHNSQNGVVIPGNPTAQAQLLLGNGCVGCHIGGTNDGVTGKDAAKFGAPQVGAAGAPAVILSGGYFDAAMADNQVHNITGYDNLDAQLGVTPPGSAGGRVAAIAAGGGFTCGDCHDATGGHHGSSGVYRLLNGVTVVAAQADYGVQGTAIAAGVGDRSATQYNDTMNTFCASCHGGFHGTANQGTAATAFVRHPTDNVLTGGNGASVPAGIVTTDNTPITATDQVMCLSCHVPHGGPRADLLSFTYSAAVNVAGGGVASTGCETCHSYLAGGM